MGEFTTRTLVRCPVAQGARRLSQYVAAHGDADGDAFRLRLEAEVPTGTSREGLIVEKSVVATLRPIHPKGAMFPHYAVGWAPENGGPFPRFAGRLILEPDDDYNAFYLCLAGDYSPPLGIAGMAFDAVIGRKLAKSTIAHLLLSIADFIEQRFKADERAKIAFGSSLQFTLRESPEAVP